MEIKMILVKDGSMPDFHLGETPVTQAQWQAVMGNNPSRFKGETLPVEKVSWDDVQVFLKKLEERTGTKYRLPSEAEWEFAARGGTKSKGFEYSGGNDLNEVGWYWENSGDNKLTGSWDRDRITKNNGRTHPVKSLKENELGLFDMSGNVWEWCEDVWHENYSGAPSDGSAWNVGGEAGRRVVRGGSWNSNPIYCRAAFRCWFFAGDRYYLIGFRLARN
jgi:formylglycine-generating enzyme required for sulfatase activity